MLGKIREKLRNFRKNEKGITSWEVAIACIVFVIVFAASVDVVKLAHAHMVTTTVTKDLARTLSVQGGVWDTAPMGYTENYYTTGDLQTLVERELSSVGIKSDEWKVYVKDEEQADYYSTPLLTASSGLNYTADYLSSFSVKIEAKYRWGLFGNIMGAPITSTFNISMPGLSEWKYDYGEWEGA